MNLTELKQAFQDEVNLNPQIEQFEFSDEFNVNGLKKINYPVIWVPVPNSSKVQDTYGDEVFDMTVSIYDKQDGRDADQKLLRLDEMEVLVNKVFRDLAKNHDHIKGYESGLETIRADRLYNDELLGVRISISLTVWTGWDCL